MWIAANELPRTGGYPFYQRLSQILDTHGFDEFVEAQCAPFYAETFGRPSLTPWTYFRLLLIGYFEGIDSERGIAWTGRLIDVETHRAVFTWILEVLAMADLVKGNRRGEPIAIFRRSVRLCRLTFPFGEHDRVVVRRPATHNVGADFSSAGFSDPVSILRSSSDVR